MQRTKEHTLPLRARRLIPQCRGISFRRFTQEKMRKNFEAMPAKFRCGRCGIIHKSLLSMNLGLCRGVFHPSEISLAPTRPDKPKQKGRRP